MLEPCRCGAGRVAVAIRGDRLGRSATRCSGCGRVESPLNCDLCGKPAERVCGACERHLCAAHTAAMRDARPRCRTCRQKQPRSDRRRSRRPVAQPWWAR